MERPRAEGPGAVGTQGIKFTLHCRHPFRVKGSLSVGVWFNGKMDGLHGSEGVFDKVVEMEIRECLWFGMSGLGAGKYTWRIMG
jgi:hypothetical protein